MREKRKILVVDDSENMLEIIRRNLSNEGYSVYTVSRVLDAISIVQNLDIDLVITDLKMPQIGGIELVKYVKENHSNIEVLVITGHPSIETAVETVKIGAGEYLIKSFTDEELLSSVKDALKRKKEREVVNSKEDNNIITGIIGGSKPIISIYNAISKASKIKATVIITGETGTGKELVARAIHYNSKQASAPFVAVNCGGIPENLLESELFGYMKGAFTGATESRGGFFQAADGGSIFLDEISNTSLSMQAKLLRVLQEKEVTMIGSNKSQKIDIRVIAATNVDLLTLVKKGVFREDLYYRLNVIPINVPPLREREDDILMLANHFLGKYSKEMGIEQPVLTDKVINLLKAYSWPGNVRELENLINRLVAMAESKEIDTPDLPEMLRNKILYFSKFDRPLKDIEKEYIINVLASVNGNKSKAAEILQIDRKTLTQKIKDDE